MACFERITWSSVTTGAVGSTLAGLLGLAELELLVVVVVVVVVRVDVESVVLTGVVVLVSAVFLLFPEGE